MQSRHSTLRLPLPPLPPKPLHLTIRGNGNVPTNRSTLSDTRRNPLPTWSRASSIVVLAESNDLDDERAETKQEDENYLTVKPSSSNNNLDPLLLSSTKRRYRSRSRSSDSGGEPTVRTNTHDLSSSKANRLSIFFDSTLPNPLRDPSNLSPTISLCPSGLDDEEEVADVVPLLLLPSSPQPALSLHPFVGRLEFGELSFEGGIELVIEVEDVVSPSFEKKKLIK